MTHMTEKLKSYFETFSAFTMAVILCHFTWTVQKYGIVQLHYYDEQYIVLHPLTSGYMHCLSTKVSFVINVCSYLHGDIITDGSSFVLDLPHL
jgi:hypothetical protein